MDIESFLDDTRCSPDYAGQIVYVRQVAAQGAAYGDPAEPLAPPLRQMLNSAGVERLYSHQVRALDAIRQGRDVLIVTPTASGKSLCYLLPILDMLLRSPDGRAMMLFPTKALSQDQFRTLTRAQLAAGLDEKLSGVYDGDTPPATRRKLRDHASVLITNPDMLHAALMPQHGRWHAVLANLELLVIDELHVYSGIFGANMTNLLRRFRRLCEHYGSRPRIISCSATIGNPRELAEGLTGRPVTVIDADGSPHGRRTYVFWNPPRVRGGHWRSRRSANVEAQKLMANLVRRGLATITFSKAKMSAEMIHRYVCEKLAVDAPDLVKKVMPYRGGYRPAERRRIEARLFNGELLGVSATRALELGIDVGALDAAVVVGYPGTLASFFQQSGRAGRRSRDAVVFLIGLDTSVNQYVMTHPEYLFARSIEHAVLDVDNPYIVTGHLRCATHELPLPAAQAGRFGPHAEMVLGVLRDNFKVRLIDGTWYHAAGETPQHEISLRDYVDANVLIEDVGTGEMIGEVNRFDAPPILHPGAIYMHLGQTYHVDELDLDRNVARVSRRDVDYYTNPLGGTDIHHIDNRLRDKPFGTGRACWGEVTAYFRTGAFEKIHFYSLDRISIHELDLPTFALETMALWLVPPEDLLEAIRKADLDAHGALRGVGYATRMLLPLLMTCDTLDFSHTIGSVNSPWQAIFIYERYPHGLGFTQKAYNRLDLLMPAVLDNIRNCTCDDGCPCCVGKPLRQYATWHYERGEASITSKAAAIMLLEGYLADGGNLTCPDDETLSDTDPGSAARLQRDLRRRLERMREPQVFHPIEPNVATEYPEPEESKTLETPDVSRRKTLRTSFHKDLRRRIAQKIESDGLDPLAGGGGPPTGMNGHQNRKPTSFAGRPEVSEERIDSVRTMGDDDEVAPEKTIKKDTKTSTRRDAKPQAAAPAAREAPREPGGTIRDGMIKLGDALAARALRRKKNQD